jgi:hypothetical protein
VLDADGRAGALVLRGDDGERLADWSDLLGQAGAWRVATPLWTAAVDPCMPVAPAPVDCADHSASFASAVPEVHSGVVQSVEHARTEDGREFASLRVQVESGDLLRIALGPSGWHARGAALPAVGATVQVRAVSTRDERGLLWIASALRLDEGPELRVRREDGRPAWTELEAAPQSCSAAALLGRRVLVDGRAVGHVEDLLVERGTGAPRITWVIRRSAGGGPPVRFAWSRASIASDGSLDVRAEDMGEGQYPSESVRPGASGTAAAGPTRIGDARGGSLSASYPGASAARCRRP